MIARSLGLGRRRVLDGEQLFDLASAAGADMGDDRIAELVESGRIAWLSTSAPGAGSRLIRTGATRAQAN